MMKGCLKAIVCIMLAITIISSCCVSFGAEENKNVDDYFEALNDAKVLGFNEILMSSYNISDKYTGYVKYTDEELKTDYIKYYGRDCIDEPQVVETTPDFTYKFFAGSDNTGYSGGGGGGITGGEMYEFQKGSVLMDDFITIADATYIQRYISKMATMDVMQKFRADLDNNSEIDIMDATTLQRYLAKLK